MPASIRTLTQPPTVVSIHIANSVPTAHTHTHCSRLTHTYVYSYTTATHSHRKPDRSSYRIKGSPLNLMLEFPQRFCLYPSRLQILWLASERAGCIIFIPLYHNHTCAPVFLLPTALCVPTSSARRRITKRVRRNDNSSGS